LAYLAGGDCDGNFDTGLREFPMADDDSNKEPSAGARRIAPRRIAVLTSGGDAPGMNAAIRAVVRTAGSAGMDVFGVRRGFEGLVFGNFEPLGSRAVANIIQRGGTVLETSRSRDFTSEAGRARAAGNLRYRGIEALIAIGGDGTLAGASALSREHGMRVMFIPASIDNDVPGTDYSIGFDTAVNTGLEAIDRIRDTAFANERLFFVEVMGRDSGFIALAVAAAGGAEAVVLPEIKCDIDDLCRRLEESQLRGKRSSIVVVSEGPRTGGAIAIANAVNARIGSEARVVVLGHIQRGGTPVARDRIAASRFGIAAVRALVEERPSSLVGEDRGAVICVTLEEAMTKERRVDPASTELVSLLSI
jgi:6-phosphofructokinase 1